MTKSKALRSVVAVGTLGLVLTACGGGGDEATESPTAGETSAAAGAGNQSTDSLTIGTLLPQTGSLAFLGPPEFAGVELAVNEMNAEGGVLSGDVTLINGDSGDTSTNIASQTVDRLISEGANAIIGAASSAVTLTVIDKVTSSGVLMVSPANTSVALTDYADNGLYFRTAPPDTLQGAVLADVAITDNIASMCVLALQDAYGEGLANVVEQVFTEGGGEITTKIIYDPKAASYEAEVGQCAATNPQAITLIGFDESSKILQEMIKQGVGPQDVQLYLVDGNLSNTLAEGLPEGTLEGVKGTTPGAKPADEFTTQLLEVNPDLVDFSYAAESYDAAILIGLAAIAAGSSEGTAMAEQMMNVSGTNGGEQCDTFAACKALLEGGAETIDYEGQSGPTNMDEQGNPARASMGIFEWNQAEGKFEQVTVVEADVPAAQS